MVDLELLGKCVVAFSANSSPGALFLSGDHVHGVMTRRDRALLMCSLARLWGRPGL